MATSQLRPSACPSIRSPVPEMEPRASTSLDRLREGPGRRSRRRDCVVGGRPDARPRRTIPPDGAFMRNGGCEPPAPVPWWQGRRGVVRPGRSAAKGEGNGRRSNGRWRSGAPCSARTPRSITRPRRMRWRKMRRSRRSSRSSKRSKRCSYRRPRRLQSRATCSHCTTCRDRRSISPKARTRCRPRHLGDVRRPVG